MVPNSEGDEHPGLAQDDSGDMQHTKTQRRGSFASSSLPSGSKGVKAAGVNPRGLWGAVAVQRGAEAAPPSPLLLAMMSPPCCPQGSVKRARALMGQRGQAVQVGSTWQGVPTAAAASGAQPTAQPPPGLRATSCLLKCLAEAGGETSRSAPHVPSVA